MYHILIVEDEQIEAEALQLLVARSVENAIVHLAATGNLAMQLIDRLSQIDLMLVDINIPLPDGSEVIRYLNEKEHPARVIVTTASDDPDLVRTLLSLRVDDYLLKPVKSATLSESIRKNLRCSEEENQAHCEMKGILFPLIDSCRYPQWHDFMFDVLNGRYSSQPGGRARSVVNFLEVLSQYIFLHRPEIGGLEKNVADIIRRINMQGLHAKNYFPVMQALLTLSADIFIHRLKTCDHKLDFVERAKFHIETDLLRTVSLNEIATRSFVSACYLSRAFKKTTGSGFSRYIASRKMILAKALLQFSDMQVNAIATALSWEDASYFCRTFKKCSGVAPSLYRKKRSPHQPPR